MKNNQRTSLERLGAYRDRMFTIAKERAALVYGDDLDAKTDEAMKYPEIVELNTIIRDLQAEEKDWERSHADIKLQYGNLLDQYKKLESHGNDSEFAELADRLEIAFVSLPSNRHSEARSVIRDVQSELRAMKRVDNGHLLEVIERLEEAYMMFGSIEQRDFKLEIPENFNDALRTLEKAIAKLRLATTAPVLEEKTR